RGSGGWRSDRRAEPRRCRRSRWRTGSPRGVRLRVEEDLGVAHIVGGCPSQIGHGHLVEVTLSAQDGGPLVVNVEEGLQIGELIGPPQGIRPNRDEAPPRCAARSRTSARARENLRCECAAPPSGFGGSALPATSVRQSEDVVDLTENGQNNRSFV